MRQSDAVPKEKEEVERCDANGDTSLASSSSFIFVVNDKDASLAPSSSPLVVGDTDASLASSSSTVANTDVE